jgi:hypothetical protein
MALLFSRTSALFTSAAYQINAFPFAIPLLAGPLRRSAMPFGALPLLFAADLRHCFAMPSLRSAFPLLHYAFAPLFNALAFLYSSSACLCSSEAMRFGPFP